jgi:hypothetical protein
MIKSNQEKTAALMLPDSFACGLPWLHARLPSGKKGPLDQNGCSATAVKCGGLVEARFFELRLRRPPMGAA